MPIMFQHDGQRLDVDDVPLDTLITIQEKTGVEWYRLNARPLAHAAAGQMLARECAKILGVELPETITPRVFVDLFEVVDEPNLPTEYQDGMPDPLEPGSEPETT